ncbi:MAG: ABC transporter permease [Bacteroidales bacterium]|nr:ABC transporter permease [Candidatus Liminaster caballi]
MSRIGIIIKREYLQMVAKKSFIVTTLLVPILTIVVCGVLPVMLSNVKSDEKKTVAVVDLNPGAPFASVLADTDEYIFNNVEMADGAQTMAEAGLHDFYASQNDGGSGLYALIVIPADFEQTARVNIYSDKSVAMSLENTVNGSLRGILRDQRIASYGIDCLATIIRNCDVRLDVRNVKWNAKGEETLSSADLSMIIGLVLAMMTYMFVMMYGAMIMSGVVEEKANRIVEVIVSTCKPIELMLGKIIGVALVGFTQLALWGVILSVVGAAFGIGSMVSNPSAIAGMAGADQAALDASVQALDQAAGGGSLGRIVQMVLSINFPLIIGCFLLYFAGGYLLYASVFAAFGSAVDQQSDTSQFMGPVMMVMVFALYAAMFSMENPDGPLAFWCSMIPFTSPIVMMIRLPYDIPFWQLASSLAILFATAFLILWLSARIYRTGILMYGRKFTWKDILRWIKQ